MQTKLIQMLKIAVILSGLIIIGCKKSLDPNTYTISVQVSDWDSRAPIAGAKVYATEGNRTFPYATVLDSAVTDVNGIAAFTYSKDKYPVRIATVKSGYITPLGAIYFISISNPGPVSRTETIYLARESNISLTMHRTGVYNSGDSIALTISGYKRGTYAGTEIPSLVPLAVINRLANAADTLLTIPHVYFAPPHHRSHFQWNIIRNGSIIQSNQDSTDLIQYGTKSHTLNY